MHIVCAMSPRRKGVRPLALASQYWSRRRRGGSDPRFTASALVVRSLDGVALQLGEGDEGHRHASVDVGALDRDLAARLLLDDLEDVLRTRRPDRDHHDAAGLELLQQRRGDVVDAAGDDDLVEGARLLPAVIAVGLLAVDRLELGVAERNEGVVKGAGALGLRLDVLDGPPLVSEV